MRACLARIQWDLDAIWLELSRIITDASHWNTLVKQKDEHYLLMFMASTRRLQRKFVGLFRVYPNESYTDAFPDHLPAIRTKERTQPSTHFSSSQCTLFSPGDSKDSSVLIENSAASVVEDLISWVSYVSTSPGLLNSTTDSAQLLGSASTDWHTARSALSVAESVGDSELWTTPDSVPFVTDPEISTFSSLLDTSPRCSDLNMAFVGDYPQDDSVTEIVESLREPTRTIYTEGPRNSLFCSPLSDSWCSLPTPVDAMVHQAPVCAQGMWLRSGEQVKPPDASLHQAPDCAQGMWLCSGTQLPKSPTISLRQAHSSVELGTPSDLQLPADVSERQMPPRNQHVWRTVSTLDVDPLAICLDMGQGSPGGSPSSVQLPFSAEIPHLYHNDPRLLQDVVNLSPTPLSQQQVRALNLSLKFRETPRFIPFAELVAGVECAAKELERDDLEGSMLFRTQCARVLQIATKEAPNLPKDVRTSLKSLSKNENIRVTVSDKGGKLVVLSDKQYGVMCLEHLKDPAYEKVLTVGTGRSKVVLAKTELFSDDYSASDPCDKLLYMQCHSLTDLLSELQRTQNIGVRERLALIPGQPYSGNLPHFYGLLKIHKLGILLIRPIISNSGFYSDKVMLKLKAILNLLLWGNTSLKNSYELVNILRNFEFGPKDKLMSFDVSSLFTRVPVFDTLQIVERRLDEIRELSED